MSGASLPQGFKLSVPVISRIIPADIDFDLSGALDVAVLDEALLMQRTIRLKMAGTR